MNVADFDKEAIDNIHNISENYEIILDYLFKAEGGKIHRNPNESDITSGRGIYKTHNKGRVWDYVNALAISAGITTNTTKWGNSELNKINSLVNPTTMKYFEYLFYKDYYDRIYLDKFPKKSIIIISSIFANTEVGAIKALQYAILMLHKMNPNYLNLDPTKISEVDGKIGSNTLLGLSKVASASSEVQDIFNVLLTLYAVAHHSRLVANNPKEFLVYLNGWINRDMNMLLETVEKFKE